MDLAGSLPKRATALTMSDVASLLNISERQVYKLAAEGRIPCFKIGNSIRFDPGRLSCVARAENEAGLGGRVGTVRHAPGVRKLACGSPKPKAARNSAILAARDDPRHSKRFAQQVLIRSIGLACLGIRRGVNSQSSDTKALADRAGLCMMR